MQFCCLFLINSANAVSVSMVCLFIYGKSMQDFIFTFEFEFEPNSEKKATLE